MTTATTSPATSAASQRTLGRSIGAIALAFVAVFVLSLGTDQVLHVLAVYPPWGQPMHEVGLNLLALSYRLVITVFGGYLAARLAPRAPMKHALILGGIGFVMSLLGAIGASQMNLSPLWYPIALVVTALPCTWLGGVLYARRAGR